MQEIYNILTITLGVLPLPDRLFTYEYTGEDEQAHSWTSTPRQFYKQFSSENLLPASGVSLINDQRIESPKLCTVEKLGNVWGGRDIAYVNTTVERMKAVVVAVCLVLASAPAIPVCSWLTALALRPTAKAQSRPTTLLQVRRWEVLQHVLGNHGSPPV